MHTLLFSDVVDSTLLTQRLGDARARDLWSEHDRLAREAMRRHHGREIDRADGFFLIFDSAADAARYALDYHAVLSSLGMAARVGLHVGEVTLREIPAADVVRGAKPIEVEGLAKPIAARVMALARGGQTLLSDALRLALLDGLDPTLCIESHGRYRLKGIEEPLEVFELGSRDHCGFIPPHDSDKAHRVVRDKDLWRPLREVRHNLPAERDTFIGRDADLRELARRLDGGSRLLTLLGPAGTGKTRLVRRYGLAWLGDWPGGVYFCDLSEARSLDGIHFIVSVALDVRLGSGDAGANLGHAIAGRGRCLVILDNFEQLVEHAAATVGRWLDPAGDAAFVVTSRERLHLAGERVLPVEPLPLDTAAIELFAARARERLPLFAITEANRGAVIEVVRLLDGLPLAIELAAARVQVLSPAQLVERMRDRFRLLAGVGGVAARQATLKAAIDWSWKLLTPWEQAALAQATVFEGGFTLAAAEAVLDLSSWTDAPSVMDVVQSLVDKSLLRCWMPAGQDRHAFDEPYFGMYLSIRDFAAAICRADDSGAEQAAQQRHGRYFAGFGSDEAIDALSVHGAAQRQRALQLELDNVVAACRRSLVRGDAATAVATYRAAWAVFALRGPLAVGAALGAQVAAIAELDETSRDDVRVSQAQAAAGVGRSDEARDWLEQALAHARRRGDRRQEGKILGRLGSLSISQRRLDEARACCEAAVAIHREIGNPQGEGPATADLALAHHEQGRLELAHDHYARALALLREVGNRRLEGLALGNLANLYAYQGRFDDALSRYDQALAIHSEVGNRRSEGMVLGNLGELHDDHGLRKEALAFYESALRITLEMGDRQHEVHLRNHTGHLLLDEGRVDEARSHFDQALVVSRAMRLRPMEGMVQSRLGELLLGQGRLAEARAALNEGEALLREFGDTLELAGLHCVRGRLDLAENDVEAARRALAAVEAAPVTAEAGPGTRLARDIAMLRDALATHCAVPPSA
ncbi:MAG: tetratricopeptide repeat protein [Caldimonas sp.]